MEPLPTARDARRARAEAVADHAGDRRSWRSRSGAITRPRSSMPRSAACRSVGNYVRSNLQIDAAGLDIYVTNLLGIVFTLGLFYPWAKVRQTRYQLENMAMDSDGNLSRLHGRGLARTRVRWVRKRATSSTWISGCSLIVGTVLRRTGVRHRSRRRSNSAPMAWCASRVARTRGRTARRSRRSPTASATSRGAFHSRKAAYSKPHDNDAVDARARCGARARRTAPRHRAWSHWLESRWQVALGSVAGVALIITVASSGLGRAGDRELGGPACMPACDG